MQTFIWTLVDCIDKYCLFSHILEILNERKRKRNKDGMMCVLENIFRILWLAIIRLPFNNKIAT